MCHVLIIEDEILIALDLRALLEDQGTKTFAFAGTQAEAVEAAREQKPDFITADVALLEGTGPKAVETILQEIGPVPVVFITGTPEACHPCPPPARVLDKPLQCQATTYAQGDGTDSSIIGMRLISSQICEQAPLPQGDFSKGGS